MTDDLIEMHINVRGDVQGVGFRYTTLQYAQQLGLKGNVCNLSDGSVDMHVLGRKETIDLLVSKLQQTFGGYVRETIIGEIKPARVYADFTIVRGK